MRRNELVPVEIEGILHWAQPEALAAAPERAEERVHILSPFDPLVPPRKRLRLFFGYEHRFEAYVPKEKRRFGYFAQPVLAGDDVAVIDLKADRERGRLLVQQWTWLTDRLRRLRKRQIEQALHRFERFQIAPWEVPASNSAPAVRLGERLGKEPCE